MPVVVFSILIKEIEALARKRVNNGRPLERERERKKERERERERKGKKRGIMREGGREREMEKGERER